MMRSVIFCRLCSYSRRAYSSKIKAVLSEEVQNDIEAQVYKPKKHPGVMEPKTVILPQKLIDAIENVLEDQPVKKLLEEGKSLSRHLENRTPLMEKQELLEKQQIILAKIIENESKKVKIETEKDEKQFKQKVHDKLTLSLKKRLNWKPIDYNVYTSMLYMMGRFAPEYACLVKIFSEVKSRDKEFKPRSFFDFGSGVGTAIWAAKQFWENSIFEYLNVDISADMNDLSQLLLQGGRGNKNPIIKGVFYRQFLPARNITYDLVISAFSLLELPTFKTRMETILKLWNKTEKYLVIVEHGSNAGFKIVNEARDFILQIQDEQNIGHVFSPCPHDFMCPRFLANDGTPCNFIVSYHSLPIGEPSDVRKELYSYVVLKKGKRKHDELQWPRIVREVLVRSKHTICRMCTPEGKLQEVIFTGVKQGKVTYRCARGSKWGDLLPVNITRKELLDNEKSENDNKTQIEH